MVVGTSALLVVLIESMEARVWATPIHLTLALYSLYGLVVYQFAVRRKVPGGPQDYSLIDLLWYMPLVAFSIGTSSFYYFFFFSIIVASFSWGLSDGLRLTLASAAIYTIVAAVTYRPIALNRLLLAPIGLLIFGYIIARWGGYHTELKNRLKLLKDVTVFQPAVRHRPNDQGDSRKRPRLLRRGSVPARDSGKGGNADSYQLYRVACGIHPSRSAPPEIGPEAASQVLSAFARPRSHLPENHSSHARLFDVKARVFSEATTGTGDKLAGMLEAQRYLSVPVYYRHQAVGRLYIVNSAVQFDSPDMDFMLQLMDHVTPVMENIRLIDNLASDAAETERRRIAHDIHDSVIQPYLGIQFGLSALDQKLESGDSGIRENVQELLELTKHELAELRRFVWTQGRRRTNGRAVARHRTLRRTLFARYWNHCRR